MAHGLLAETPQDYYTVGGSLPLLSRAKPRRGGTAGDTADV